MSSTVALFNLMYIIFKLEETFRGAQKFDAKHLTAFYIKFFDSSIHKIANITDVMIYLKL